jgi:RNA-directed DNA polymerase
MSLIPTFSVKKLQEALQAKAKEAPTYRFYALYDKVYRWANYFCLGPVSPAYRAIDQHVSRRLRQWLCAKHKVPGGRASRFSHAYLYQVLRLAKLGPRTHTFPWAKA